MEKLTHDKHQSSIIKPEGLYQTWRFVGWFVPLSIQAKIPWQKIPVGPGHFRAQFTKQFAPSDHHVAFTKCTQRKRGASSSNLHRLTLKLSTHSNLRKIIQIKVIHQRHLESVSSKSQSLGQWFYWDFIPFIQVLLVHGKKQGRGMRRRNFKDPWSTAFEFPNRKLCN